MMESADSAKNPDKVGTVEAQLNNMTGLRRRRKAEVVRTDVLEIY